MDQYQNLFQPQLCRKYLLALLDEDLVEAKRIQDYCRNNRINIWYETIELLEYHRGRIPPSSEVPSSEVDRTNKLVSQSEDWEKDTDDE